MNLRLRKGLIQVHLWSGLGIALVLFFTALAGAALAWRPQLEHRLSAGLFTVEPSGPRLPLDEVVQRARAAHPGGSIESVRYFGDPTAPSQVYFSDQRYVHVNPYTGKVLGSRPRYGAGFGWVEGFHKMLQLTPSLGEPLVGSMALVFIGIIFTGLVLSWPASRRALRAGLTLNWKLSGRPWHLSLHKVIGAYAALIVLTSAVTGVPIALDWAKNALYPLTGSKRIDPPRAKALAPGFAGFSAVAAQLDRRMPGAEEDYIALPKNGVVSSYAVAAGSPHPNARSYLWLNPVDAAVLRYSPYAETGAGFKVYFWMLSFHSGLIGGWPVQLILCLGALSVPLLIVTGLTSFLKRKAIARPARQPKNELVSAATSASA